ncbi:retrovirus-related pol polyprotein from transposon TNT 1-94 [Tanacetum coccineum]
MKISDLNASLQDKALAITTLKDELRKLKVKALVDNNVSNHPSDPELHQVNVETITPKLLNKRTTHSAYIKHSQEEAAVLKDLVDHIQEMLSKISKTCPTINSSGEQLVAVTPMNKVKSVRFTEPVTSSRNTKIAHTSNLVSNKPMLSSTRVKQSTSASRSQPSGNTKKDKIQQTQSRILKNKVEAYPRKVKSSMKNNDCVVAPKGIAHVHHFKLNANYELKCVKPTGRTFTIVGNACPLTRVTTATEVPLRESSALDNKTPKPVVTLVYSRKPRKSKTSVLVKNYKYLDSGCSKHMTGDRSQLTNFVNKFLGTVKFGNDHVAKIMGYEDYQIGNVIISRVYYVEGLGHNLFSVGQFCLPKLKFEKDHLCSACAIGKSTKKPHKPKSEDTNQEKLYLLHMDLCGPMRVVSVNVKNYILVIVDDYSRFTWVKCLRSKDEAPSFIINFLKMIQVRLKETICRIRTNNGTEFVNQTLREYYKKVGISHETFVTCSPQQNGVVER